MLYWIAAHWPQFEGHCLLHGADPYELTLAQSFRVARRMIEG